MPKYLLTVNYDGGTVQAPDERVDGRDDHPNPAAPCATQPGAKDTRTEPADP